MVAYDYNVDGLRPGDRVDIVGIYRVNASKLKQNFTGVRSIYNSFLDMISFGKIE